jgi:DNA invertase Pin-like site-specific DNA recombinase
MHARVYVRISDAHRQERGVSLEKQLADIEEYATAHALIIMGRYIDKMSGKKVERPEYQRLLAEMQPGDTVLVWRIDRMGRNKAESFRMVDEIFERKVRFVSVTQPATEHPQARDLMILVAAWESETIAARVRPTMAHCVERGKWVSRPPKWYKLVGDEHNRRLVPDEPKPCTAQACWEMFLATGSLMNTSATYGMSPKQLRRMMLNPAYVGDVEWADLYYRDAHEPIVRRDTWEAARAALLERTVRRRRERHVNALLTGYIYVGGTDRRMYQRRAAGETQTYYMSDRNTHGPNYSIRADMVEGEVLAWLRGLSIPPDVQDEVNARVRAHFERDLYADQRQYLERRLAEIQSERVGLVRLAARGQVDDATFDVARRELATDETRVRDSLAALPSPPNAEIAMAMVEARVGLATKIDEAVALEATDALRHLVEGFIARVDVYTEPSPLSGKGRGGRAVRWNDRPAPRIVITPTDAVDVVDDEEMPQAAD